MDGRSISNFASRKFAFLIGTINNLAALFRRLSSKCTFKCSKYLIRKRKVAIFIIGALSHVLYIICTRVYSRHAVNNLTWALYIDIDMCHVHFLVYNSSYILNMHCARQPLSLLIDLTTKDDDYRLTRLLLMSRQNITLHYRIRISKTYRLIVSNQEMDEWDFKISAFSQSIWRKQRYNIYLV